MLRIKLLTAAVIAVLSIGTLQAQETEEVKNAVVDAVEAVAETSEAASETEKASATAISLDEEGNLVGSTFIAGEETPLEAKVTIANADGVVVDTVLAKEDGSFAFSSIAPGSYNMYGSAASYVGAQAIDVVPYSGGGCSSCDLGLSSYSSNVYDTYASAPVSACGSCGGCGCGGGGLFGRSGGGLFSGGGGGGLFGGGGGGLLGGSRFLRLAAIGGVVAIASSDSSPDN